MEAIVAPGVRPSLVLHEDEDLLVVDKPAGINTHSANFHAGEGIYEWLKRREPRWADLAILQRLDKETSGVLVFSKTRRGNVSLFKQFSKRRAEKEYVLQTDRNPRRDSWTARSFIRKISCRFESVDDPDEGLEAETRFTVLSGADGRWTVRAEPRTGRTHQIRIHASNEGIPILGDTLYGGTPHSRLCLHARALRLRHPATNEPVKFLAEPDFDASTGAALRRAVIDPSSTSAYRLVHGAADDRPGWYVDRLGAFLLASHDEGAVGAEGVPGWLTSLAGETGATGIYRRRLDRQVRASDPESASPEWCWGATAPDEFDVRENGLRYRLSFREGYSVGLFLDQRDNRRRLQTNWVGPQFPVRPGGLSGAEVLNLFAYTCGFSVAAASAGARATSLDLSRKYLDWGRRNFEANGFDPNAHDFIYGDAIDWLRRLGRKGRRFGVVVIDPPTFSKSKERGVFRVESDYASLVTLAVGVLAPGGVLLASTNTSRLEPERWRANVAEGLSAAGRSAAKSLFIPQPPDFPTSRDQPGYLKTLWLMVP
ncbi:MAG: class I SAM-dependent methyltransferase [Limisphaerales bacterium]